MIWPFTKRRPTPVSPRWPLSRSLFTLAETDDFTLADACEGIAIFGATGSGKSSGSGRHISQAYL